MNRSARIVLLLAGAALALHGTTMIRASLADLIQKSTSIIRGRVTGTYCESGPYGVFTKVKVKVVERWKGADVANLEVTVPGGTCNGVSQSVAGAPDLGEGQEYVFFLWAGRSRANQLLGLGQGVLDITTNDQGEAMVSRGPVDAVLLDSVTGKVVKDQSFSMRLNDFGQQVRRSLGADK